MSRLFEKFKQDIVGILLLATGLFVGLALASFNPTDPSINSIGHNLKVTNYCGYVGSFLSDALFQLFGLSAWLLVAGLGNQGLKSLQGKSFSLKNLRLVWGSLLILTLASLCSVYFPQSRLFQEQIPVGGLIGLSLSQAMIRALNMAGAQVVLWSGFLVLVVFFSEKTVEELFSLPIKISKKINLKAYFANMREKTKQLKPKKKQKLMPEIEENIAGPTLAKAQFVAKAEEVPEEILPVNDPEQLEIPGEEMQIPTRRKVVMKTKVQRRIENWELPKLSMLEDPPASRVRIDEKEIRRKADILTNKLSLFGVMGEVTAARPGPAVTMFEFKPATDVRVNKITGLEDDLSLALSSESLRILAPIPGRDVVGIETSNAQRETVYLKDMLADENFWKEDMKLPLALGKQANGEPKIIDLRKMPHLMVAGTTGSGKSVFTVSAITGLIFKHSPKTLRLIMIDPKQVDLAAFEKIPHLAMPPVRDSKQAVSALKWAVREMEKRYKSMQKFGSRGLEQFNESVSALTKDKIEEHDKLNQEFEGQPGKKSEQYYFQPQPYIVIVIEEFGDLMAVDKANVENSIVRLAQKARASGIHLLLAMQSPRREVVTGLIKTNIPGRISFKVSSGSDSRIILDEGGAERLLAQGDMLFKNPGGSNTIRHHGPFLKDAEINAVAKFWSDQAEPEYDPAALKAIEGNTDSETMGGENSYGDESHDEKYDEILAWASTQKEISASLIQRRFQLGYPRAARIVETFEREGVVGPSNGAKPRQVLVNNLSHL